MKLNQTVVKLSVAQKQTETSCRAWGEVCLLAVIHLNTLSSKLFQCLKSSSPVPIRVKRKLSLTREIQIPFGFVWAARPKWSLTSIKNPLWKKKGKRGTCNVQSLVLKVIRLFTDVQPIESIYTSPEARERRPAVSAWRILLCRLAWDR